VGKKKLLKGAALVFCAVVAAGFFQVAHCQGIIGPNGFASYNPFNEAPQSLLEFLSGIGLTSVRAGVFYGSGEIRVDHLIGEATRRSVLVWADFGNFTHHRKVKLTDTYFLGRVGIGSRGLELLTLTWQTNLGRISKFTQFTDADYSALPYRSAFDILVLKRGESGLIELDTRNKYNAFALCGRLPILGVLDILAGYKYSRIKSNIDPYSSPLNPAPPSHLPGLSGWIPDWVDSDLTSVTGFQMNQRLTWHGAFVGAGINWDNYGFRLSFDTRLYPWLFGKYQFEWGGQYLDPFLSFAPGIFGSQLTTIKGHERWAVEFELRCRGAIQKRLALEVLAQFQHLSMRHGSLEYQSTGNVYGATIPSYWGAGNYDQLSPEGVNVRQQLWMVGANLEMAL
jgi:hypothetical protein